MRCKWMTWACLTVLLLLLTACGVSKEANPLVVPGKAVTNDTVKTPVGQKNIALVMKTLTNPFFCRNGKRGPPGGKRIGH